MTISNDDYRVGNKRPPLHSRFQKGNQAARGRRRKVSGKSQMTEGLRDALQQDVPLQQNGKRRKVRLSYAIGQQIAQQLAQADLQVRIKAWGDLKKYGLLELFDGEAQLDEERAEFEEEKREFARRERDAKIIHRIVYDEFRRERIRLRCAYDMLKDLREQCGCITWEGEFLRNYEQLTEVVISREEADELSVSLFSDNAASEDSSEVMGGGREDGDLREGMLGFD